RLEGIPVPLTLRHGAHVVSAEPACRRMPSAAGAPPPGGAPRARPCPAPSREYDAAYELVGSGTHVCLYRASRGPFEAYPIVRQDSFRYDDQERAKDRERVREFLAATPRV